MQSQLRLAGWAASRFERGKAVAYRTGERAHGIYRGTVQLLLVRHALPLRSEPGQGSDPHLSEEGIEQAKRLPDALARFPISRLVSSPQIRSIQTARPVADAQTVLAAQRVAREVPIAEHVLLYAARLIGATHPDRTELDSVRRYVRWGASPRGLQTLVLAAKVRALLEGRYNVAFDDLSAVAQPALRHRIFLQFEAEADGMTADRLVAEILEHTVKEPARA